MIRSHLVCASLLLVACGSDDGGAGADAAPGIDAAPDPDQPDGAVENCFELSLDPETPLAIDGVFASGSDVWRRPHDEDPVCPATAFLPEESPEVPFVAYAFCNNDTVPHLFNFEMISTDGPNGEAPLDDPYLFVYRGQALPANELECAAVNDDIPDALDTSDSLIEGFSIPPGEAITLVGTTFTFSPGEEVGTGYYILTATVADQ